MNNQIPEIDICVCTFRRPTLLAKLLRELENQVTDGRFAYSVVVADNDGEKSAESVVRGFLTESRLKVSYCVEPERNIAKVRNKALSLAKGDYVAFIDDDEYPDPLWLRNLLEACLRFNVAGVLGPVRPYFDEGAPCWVTKGKFFDRPEHPTGFGMHWEQCRTGNVLFRRAIIKDNEAPFDLAFGTGGEDKDFFLRFIEKGNTFIWCNEAPVYELVPTSRCNRSYLLNRALCRGKNIIKHRVGRIRLIGTSLAAVPLYTLMLPFMFVGGNALFMKYAIKFCDHIGRLLAVIGLNPVSERRM